MKIKREKQETDEGERSLESRGHVFKTALKLGQYDSGESVDAWRDLFIELLLAPDETR